MAKKLHHRAERYELQSYQPHSISWKPIAHSNDVAQLETQANAFWAKLQSTPKAALRILDRKDGAQRAILVKTWGNPEVNNTYGK